ncbi:MAG: GC-type dockerin domain-anchored protein [Phycisphaerales bacterium]
MTFRRTSRVSLSILTVAAAGLVCERSSFGQPVRVDPLVLAGDVYGPGNVQSGFAAAENFAVNNSGNWLIEVAVNLGFGVLISGSGVNLPGTVYMTEGDPVASPAGATISSFDAITLNNAGNSAFNLLYAGATASTDSGVHYNSAQLIPEGSTATAPQFSAGTPYIGWFEVRINDANQILMLASVDDPATSTTVDRALVRIDDPAGAATQTVLLKEGDELIPGRFLTDVATNPHQFAFANGSRAATIFDVDGSTIDDSGVAIYDGLVWSIAAREGDPSPYAGRLFSSFSSQPIDINNSGVWVVRADLDGATTDDAVILKNGTVEVAREGGDVHGLSGVQFTGFGTGAVRIDDSGRVFYYAAWNDPNATTNSGIFRDQRLLVRKGVTTVQTIFGTELLTDISAVQDNFTISDNGRYLIFEGVITEQTSGTTRRGSFMVRIFCPGDFNADGQVSVQDIFDFLSAYFNNDPAADINGDGLSVQDIFDFLAAYFSTCG